MKNLLSTILLTAIVSFSLPGQEAANFGIPYAFPNQKLQPLRDLVDQNLQSALKDEINKNEKWKQLVAQKKMAVGLVDLRNPTDVKFARINGNVMMYAASLPKIAILLAAMDAIEKGELKETPEVKKDMRIMISRSDNHASTRMIDRLGYKKIESVLTDPRYNLYDRKYGGGLWVGKRYASMGQRYPDPIKGLSHAASVSQVCRFYYMMVYGRLVSHQRSKQMLRIMGDPELHHKFVNTLDQVAPQAKLFRKSGSWQNYHSDSILVWEETGRKYILVGLVEDAEGEVILRQLVKSAEKALRTTSFIAEGN